MDETGVLLTCRPMATGSCRAWTEVPAPYALRRTGSGAGRQGRQGHESESVDEKPGARALTSLVRDL